MEKNYLESIRKQFLYYKWLGDETLKQLDETALFWQQHPESNSIAVIVNHLQGNMKSRWTDFLTADGEKEWRNREREFENIIQSKMELLQLWEEGWACLFEALDSVDEANFDTIIYIRHQGHTIVEAFNRQMAHYAYHVGQITYIGRMIKGAEWQSLSIPKGQSETFNAEKFAKDKERAHFTDEFLNNKS